MPGAPRTRAVAAARRGAAGFIAAAMATVVIVPALSADPGSSPRRAAIGDPGVLGGKHLRVVKGGRSYVRTQWALRAIAAPKVARRHRLAKVVVATIDTGIELNHPDLRHHAWHNPRPTEAPLSQGIVPKGASGWDLIDRDPHPGDIGGHGTAVAGVIAAQIGNEGVDGVAPNARLMAMRACTKQPTEDIVCSDGSYAAAIDWAASKGARIIHLSWSQGGGRAVAAVVAAHPEVLFVATAGNGYGANDDLVTTPLNCTLPDANLICVAASKRGGRVAPCASVGPRSVDLAAPGMDISTTLRDRRYLLHSQCAATFAAPYVTGVAALLFGVEPGANPLAVKKAILAGARPSSAWRRLTVTGGIVDAVGALRALGAR